MHEQAWWAVALTESVTGDRPLAAVCAGHELVLFRDASGRAVALEDRCPHRRVPLSLGCIKPDGLQCAYHGWTFDGATGDCTAIPNLGTGERVPARYGAIAYHVAEAAGFVHVWLGADEPAEAPPAGDYRPSGREVTGSAIVGVAHDEYLAAMLDGPQVLLGFDGIEITDFFLGDAQRDGDHLVLDRGAVWRGSLPGPAFVTDHPLLLRTAVPLRGGLIRVELLSADETPVATLHIGSGRHRRGTTGLCWRGFAHDLSPASAPRRWRLARAAGRPLLRVFDRFDGAAFAALLAEPSQQLRAVRYGVEVPLRFAV
jgi:nitrite reductase/ring-hydroxylating ferredoxin subunit